MFRHIKCTLCLIVLFVVSVAQAGARLEADELPGFGQNVLMVAQAVYFGLSGAVNRHTTSWKHPYGETVVVSTQVFIVLGSLLHFLLIHIGPWLRLQGSWVLALHLTLPSPLLVPTVFLATYRAFGMRNRLSMRKDVAKWENLRGNLVPYWMMTNNLPGFIINVLTVAGTGYSLYTLGFREGGVPYPVFSAPVVLLLSGVLGAVPVLRSPGGDDDTPDAQQPCQVPIVKDSLLEVPGDQILIPVLGWSNDTSIIVVRLPWWSSNIHIERWNSNLAYTPYTRVEFGDALKGLMRSPPDAAETEAFVKDFTAVFDDLSEMFHRAAALHSPSDRFAKVLSARKRVIFDDLRIFDGNSTKMRALAMIIINMVLRKKDVLSDDDYPVLKSVPDLVAWAYGKSPEELVPMTYVHSTEYGYHEAPSADNLSLLGVDQSSTPLLSAHGNRGTQHDASDDEQNKASHGFVLRDANSRDYNMVLLDQMVERLSASHMHELMFFLLLERMARNNDTRLAQIETLAGGHDVTIVVGERDVKVTTHSTDVNIVTELYKNNKTGWDHRKVRTGFESLQRDPGFNSSEKGLAFDRVSSSFVPVSWNPFYVIQQHVLAWMLTYMASTVLLILFDTLVKS